MPCVILSAAKNLAVLRLGEILGFTHDEKLRRGVS